MLVIRSFPGYLVFYNKILNLLDNKPLKKEEPKPEEPPPVKEDELKSEDSLDFHGDSSSDSDEPIKKKMKRKAKEAKAKANGAKKKPGKTAKKQKAGMSSN